MIYNILSPHFLTIKSDSLKNAIKNYIKINYDLHINNIIIKDRMHHMQAKIKYYNSNGKNKLGIHIKPIVMPPPTIVTPSPSIVTPSPIISSLPPIITSPSISPVSPVSPIIPVLPITSDSEISQVIPVSPVSSITPVSIYNSFIPLL